MKRVSNKKVYECSNGTKVSQQHINNKLAEMRNIMCGDSYTYMCEATGGVAHDMDHTISQKRCKELHKTELIWDWGNISLSSREAHQEWESYKSGAFEEHKNAEKRMLFVKKHDHQKFEARKAYISNYKLMQAIS